MKAIVHVGLKNGVLDPQGKAVADSLNRLGFAEVGAVRVAKVIELDLDAALDAATAQARVKAMCEQLLANTVIESYRFELV